MAKFTPNSYVVKPNYYQKQKALYGNRTDFVPVYRRNEKTNQMETLPKYLSADTIIKQAQAAAYAVNKLGADPYILESLLGRIALEGREDVGANQVDENDKEALQMYRDLVDAGHGVGAMYPAAMLNKLKVAKRLGISVDEAYNGRGVNVYGQTGADYARKMRLSNELVRKDPRNAAFVSLIDNAINGKLTTVQEDMVTPWKEDRIWKQSGVNPDTFHKVLPRDKWRSLAGKDTNFSAQHYIVERDRELRGAKTGPDSYVTYWRDREPGAAAAAEEARIALGKLIKERENPSLYQQLLNKVFGQ